MQTLTSDTLAQARQQAEAGQFTEALVTIRAAKEADPRNVYILAIERQLVKLVEFSDPSHTSREEASDTLELFQALIDQALGGAPDRGTAVNHIAAGLEQNVHPGTPNNERDNAIAVLKTQYITRADGCMIKGDYQGALLEIRRIYVLDPDNETARQYEERIQGLLTPEAAAPVRELPTQQAEEPTFSPEPLTFGDDTLVFGESEDHVFHPPLPQRTLPRYTLTRETSHPRSTKKFIIAALVVIVAGSSAYYMWWKKSADEKLMARFTENQSTAPAPRVKPPDNKTAIQPTEQSTDSRVVDRAATTKPVVEPPTAKQIAPSRSEAAPVKKPITGVEKGSSTGNPTSPSLSSELNSTGAEALKTKDQGEKSSITKPVTSQTPQPLTPADPKPLSTAARDPEVPQTTGQFVPFQKEPKLVRLEKVRFAEDLVRQGIIGDVIVRVRISTQGKPLEARVLKSSNPILDGAVIEAVMNSEYSPGMMSTGPVATWVTIPFKFKR